MEFISLDELQELELSEQLTSEEEQVCLDCPDNQCYCYRTQGRHCILMEQDND